MNELMTVEHLAVIRLRVHFKNTSGRINFFLWYWVETEVEVFMEKYAALHFSCEAI